MQYVSQNHFAAWSRGRSVGNDRQTGVWNSPVHGGFMGDKRRHMRVTCKSACLVYYEHRKYCGIMQDFSPAGAAVRLFGANAGFMRTGDICSLVFCTDPESDCRSYTSRITRISPHLIALEFLEMPR